MAERHGFHEAHFTSLPCQSNVYGLTCLAYPDGLAKVLVAPLKDKVVSLEYVAGSERGKLKPIAKDIHFAGIPDDAEIIGIDSYQRVTEGGGGHTIAITFTKDAETENPIHFLNLYAPWEKGSEYVLDGIDQTWTNVELDFTPFYLCHTKILEDGEREIVYLLTGSDKQVHLYREESGGRFSFSEHPVSSLFPEFKDLPCVALWLEFRNLSDSRRLSAVGCRSGYIRLSLVNTKNNKIVEQWETCHDSAITCLRIFTSATHIASPTSVLDRMKQGDEDADENEDDGEGFDGVADCDYSLLVTSALEVAVVYRRILKEGFKRQLALPQSDMFDCALCSCVADLNWDGHNELLIGTYGQVLLVYKFTPFDGNNDAKDAESPKCASPDAKEDDSMDGITFTVPPSSEAAEPAAREPNLSPSRDGKSEASRGLGRYELLWSRNFATPILALNHFDLTGDGLREIIVLSTRGLHILQHNLDNATQRCLEGLRHLVAGEPT